MSGNSGDPDSIDSARPVDETRREGNGPAQDHNESSVDISFPSLPDPELLENGDDDSGPNESISLENTKEAEALPASIGRYNVISLLGEGGFGSVYLAHDPKLNRKVAIKLPRFESNSSRRNSFIEEGRSVARLSHPSIVKIYNIEEAENGDPFVVMEFVEGPTLRDVIEKQGLTYSTSLKYLIQLAEALNYAHQETLIHRDIKPANVVVSSAEDVAKLMDFGMAIHDLTPDARMPSHPEGTPPYMAPEQVRGENHRLDFRTDIWAFGVLMYIMLTGRKPFTGKKLSELVEKICLDEPRTPRSINKTVPAELERICLKCLEKLMSSRYQSTSELVEDLTGFESSWTQKLDHDPSISSNGILPSSQLIRTEPSGASEHSGPSETGIAESGTVRVVPKGLRSFDGQDAEFFVDLLPGPKDRFGVPESLRFWTNRISKGAEDPVSVGMVFGPSGCGKSSFVKAGLIPRLIGVKTVYIEASPNDTEKRIIEKLEAVAPQVVREEQELDRVFARIRRGQLLTGEKLLVVIDQFEQWLHANPEFHRQQLVQALRQCDGQNLTCLLLVRDDFWMSATQFMSQLDLRVQEGVNALGIPLFDKRHARRVLTAYGRANEAFGEEISAKQAAFISEAVSEMSNNGRVIPIHLALFSQMMDSDSWDSSQLKKMGGWKGLGVHFLESIFSENRAQPHEANCRVILSNLLPDVGTKIKGAKKSFRQLLDATESRSSESLQMTLDFLDRELRIITPTESDVTSAEIQHFQLAHDYLVEPIREWLSRKEQQSRQGRARLRLAELTAQWERKKETRFLPSLLEYASMRSAARSCPEIQKKYLREADKYYALRLGLIAAAIAVVSMVGVAFWNQSELKRANTDYESILVGGPGEVEVRLEKLGQFDTSTILEIASQREAVSPKEKLHSLFVKSRFGGGVAEPNTLLDLLVDANARECANFVNAFGGRSNEDGLAVSENIKLILNRFGSSQSQVERFRLAVIGLHLGDTSMTDELLKHELDPESRIHFIESFAEWHGDIGQVVESLGSLIPSTQSGLCCAMGQLPGSEIERETREQLAGILSELTRKSDHAEVHSAAVWLNKKLGLPEIRLSRLRSADSSWLVKTIGQHDLTFVRIEEQDVYTGYGLSRKGWDKFGSLVGEEPEITRLENSFHISTKEVSAALFFEFIDSLEAEDPVRIDNETNRLRKHQGRDLPVSNASWVEAVRFCNWLSKRDKLRPCYELKKIELNDREYNTWQFVEGRSGYRLPRLLEWEAACRGGTNSQNWFGNDFSRLNKFVITLVDENVLPDIGIAERASKIPNQFGLFDVMGNAGEWNYEWLRVQGGEDPEYHYTRGGGTDETIDNYQASAFEYKPHASTTGFRLVIDLD